MTSVQFAATFEPSPSMISEAAGTAPYNPMLAPAYLSALRCANRRFALLTLLADNRPVTGCIAMVREGRLHRTVEIESWPERGNDPAFVAGTLAFSRAQRADTVEIGTFCSRVDHLPAFPGRQMTRERCEHVWDLHGDLWAGLSSNHRRNVARARKAGLVVVSGTDDAAITAHAALTGASAARRQARGEAVEASPQMDWWRILLNAGAGQLYQAHDGNVVVSSILVLRAASGVYYQSAGTSPEGMERGASQLLVFEIAQRFAAEGFAQFNLSGAEPANAGLFRFKAGFGTTPRFLAASTYTLSGPLRRAVLSAVNRMRIRMST
jgi:Acetyltransferase (GNAT) domain